MRLQSWRTFSPTFTISGRVASLVMSLRMALSSMIESPSSQ